MIKKFSIPHFPHWIWVLPILLLTASMVIIHLETDAYWGDEIANFRMAGITPYEPISIDQIIFNLGVAEWVPVYNFLHLWWGNIVGWSEFATRFLGLLIANLSVAMMYQLGRLMFNRRTGLTSAILLGSSVYLAFYAHEMRAYILYIFLTITTLYLYWE